MKGEQQTWSSWVTAVPRLLARMWIPAGTSLRKTGDNKNTGQMRKREDPQGFLLAGFPQDGCLMGQDGAECHWPAAGAAVFVGGISQPFHLVFTANSAEAGDKQQVAPGGFLAQHP